GGENDMARLAALRLPDCQRAAVAVEVADLESRELAIAAPGLQRRWRQWTEGRITGINESFGLGDLQIFDPSGLGIPKRFHSAPLGIGRDQLFRECVV